MTGTVDPRKQATITDPNLREAFQQGFAEAQGTSTVFNVTCWFEDTVLREEKGLDVHNAIRVAAEFLAAGAASMRVVIDSVEEGAEEEEPRAIEAETEAGS